MASTGLVTRSFQLSGRLGAVFFKASSRMAERVRHGRIIDRKTVTRPDEDVLGAILSREGVSAVQCMFGVLFCLDLR